jgi:glycosyltransferase involved in cell wall biosynthesis
VLLGSRIAVVVPARNEARFIEETVSTVPAFVDAIVVVDDGSRDGTGALVATLPRVTVLRHPESRGVGAAIVAGYRHARRVLGADVIAVMAGDGQMHPGDLERLVVPCALGEADYAKGDRLHHPDVWRTMPIQRHLAGVALSRLTASAAGIPGLSDSQCGFTAITGAALDALDLDALWSGYGYPNDLLAAIARRGLCVRDVVVRPVYRGEASGLRPWHLATIAYLLVRARVRRAT